MSSIYIGSLVLVKFKTAYVEITFTGLITVAYSSYYVTIIIIIIIITIIIIIIMYYYYHYYDDGDIKHYYCQLTSSM